MSFYFELQEHLWEKHESICESCRYSPEVSIDPQCQEQCAFIEHCEWVEVDHNSYLPSKYEEEY